MWRPCGGRGACWTLQGVENSEREEKKPQKAVWGRRGTKANQERSWGFPVWVFQWKSILGKIIFVKASSSVQLCFKRLLWLFWTKLLWVGSNTAKAGCGLGEVFLLPYLVGSMAVVLTASCLIGGISNEFAKDNFLCGLSPIIAW